MPLSTKRVANTSQVDNKDKKESLPWIEKYRPSNLTEVISHDSKIEVLNKLIEKRDIPHLLLYGAPGTGKCLGKGTEIRLYNGELCKVENIKRGNLLMGDDSTPRRVISTCHGKEQLYKIKQSSGIDYIVNESHIITLVRTSEIEPIWDEARNCYNLFVYDNEGNSRIERYYIENENREQVYAHVINRVNELCNNHNVINIGDSIDISLRDYLRKNQSWKNEFSGYRTGVEYEPRAVITDPYILGQQYASKQIVDIPGDYKYNTRDIRLKLLAGLIDGYRYKNRDYYSIPVKSDDIIELCYSLGFKCDSTNNYLCISGNNLRDIPVLFNKINDNKMNKIRFDLSRIEVEKLDIGEYFGFELDGNGRFLLKDYTVTHNTSLILALAKTMYGANYKRYILELNASDDRGIDIVRNRIPTFAKTKSDDMRFVILDEADAMTADAQSALRRIMELYIRTCRFCLICNNINKIIPGIQSRCAKMRFGVLDKNCIRDKLKLIADAEKIVIEDEALDQLLEIHQDFRQILNTLQCLRKICDNEHITKEDVSNYLGKASSELTKELIEIFENEPYKKCHQRLMELHKENKINIIDLIKSFVDYVINQEGMTEDRRSRLLDGLAKVEYRMITGSDTEIQLASLVGVWIGNRE